MTSYKKSQEEYSRDVYEAFQAIAVSSDMIHMRRHGHLLEETMMTTSSQIQRYSVSEYTVGSQIEGSTTIGMKSDIDILQINDAYQVVLELGVWRTGKRNILAFKDETTPPQFYKLCRLIPTPDGRQDYLTVSVSDTDVVEKGRVLISNTMFDKDAELRSEQLVQSKMVKHGPSRSHTDKMDLVSAFPCNDFPEECESLLKRPRPGHWPKPDTLKYARKFPVFFIPQGHPHSELNERNLQWRLSTSLTERALMFDFTEVQMLVYILLKMLKIENIKPQFEDNFSTFHIKTAMMFTIEKYPPDIWRIDNIVACATYCIDTLIQFTQDKIFPHFTMSGVNLFDGKLSEPGIKKLEATLTDLNNNIIMYISNLKMDRFGKRVLQKERDHKNKQKHRIEIIKTITSSNKSALSLIIRKIYSHTNNVDLNTAVQYVKNILTYLRGLQTHGSTHGFTQQCETADLMLPFVYGILANIQASGFIDLRLPTKLYKLSFEGDLMSGKLKYASMLYCSDQYDPAADMLNHCESLVGPDADHFCECFKREYECPSEKYIENNLNTNIGKLIKTSSTFCVKFCKHEIPCVPTHLRYEMYRTQTQSDKKYRNIFHQWMDLVVIDCVPFLYYLQYLVYRQTGDISRCMLAMFNLMDYICDSVDPSVTTGEDGQLNRVFFCKIKGHVDTALHVLAHCWELENRPDVSWELYKHSVSMFPTNNIAWVHLIGLFRKYFII